MDLITEHLGRRGFPKRSTEQESKAGRLGVMVPDRSGLLSGHIALLL